MRPPLIGLETEFGIFTPGDPSQSPVRSSTALVVAYAAHTGMGGEERTRWSYLPEHPLRDVRGYDLGIARPVPHISPNAPGLATMVLTNGGRFYVDHAHPEYSSPEVSSITDAVLWDKAGEKLALQACAAYAHQAAETGGGGASVSPEIVLYKNNVDGKGASYGTHENYLVPRAHPFDDLARQLIPFFVTRQIICGAGRVGIGPKSETAGFQISQRADYIETDISLETTLNRGIINTRDEPHADEEQWRRLHVIIGDANLSEVATFLKVGCTVLVLEACQGGVTFDDLIPCDPVAAVRSISHDPTLRTSIELVDGSSQRATAIQRTIYQRVASYCAAHPVGVSAKECSMILDLWSLTLDDLEKDPLLTASYLDWTAKLAVLDKLRRRCGGKWNHPKVCAADLSYSDLRPQGIYQLLVKAGRMRRLLTDEAIEKAVTEPPSFTRAWLRGTLVRLYGADLTEASWQRLSTPHPHGGMTVLSMDDPHRYTESDCAALVSRSSTLHKIMTSVNSQKKG